MKRLKTNHYYYRKQLSLPTVKTTIAVVAVNIVCPCPSGRSCTDCKARAKAMAPRSPENVFNVSNQDKQVKYSAIVIFLPLYQSAF